MIKIRFHVIPLLLLVFGFVSGCASVRVIEPVANQNERNASALEANLSNLIAITDEVLPALLGMALIDSYRDTMIAIRKSKYSPTQTEENQIAKGYENSATALKTDIDKLDPDLRPPQIEQSYRSFPFTAEIAFNGMKPQAAASLWLALDATYNMTLPVSETFKLRKQLIRNLQIISSHRQAKADIMAAYNELRSAALQQALNSKNLAMQLREAGQTRTNPGAFLKGVLEDNRVIELIGKTVESRTGDPARKKAAEDLLASVTGEEGVNETTNAR